MDPVKWFDKLQLVKITFLKQIFFSDLTMHGGWTLGLSDFVVTSVFSSQSLEENESFI